MKRFFIILSVMCAASCSVNPFLKEWTGEGGIPPFSEIKYSDYIPAVNAGIEQQEAEIHAIVNNPADPTFVNTIAAYELSGEILGRTLGVLFNLSESDATDEMMAVIEEVTPIVTEHENNIFMNPGFFQRVKAVYESADTLDREEYMVTKKLYNKFIGNGIALDEASQARFREINTRLAVLSQKFGNNLLAENNAFKEAIGIPVSSYPYFMTTCEDRAKREAAFKAYSSRGNNGNENDNKAVLLEIMKLRTEKAAMLGFDCSADCILEDKMAHDHATVDAFLSRIMEKAVAKAREEVADMQIFMDKDVEAGLLPEGSRIEPWDWWFYAEKVRKAQYALDESEVSQYFQLDNVRSGVFQAAERLYGIKIEPADIPVYHPEVKAFKVTDADGSLLSWFMTDYLPRSTKRGGAWMTNFREQYVDASGNDVRPIVVNVCNFTPPGDSVGLLTIDEVSTAFHEFGHALHGMLSKCRFKDVSGTSVARDFVEPFSQINENWAFQPEILSTYAYHYKTGEVIPDSLVAKINKASRFTQGFMTAELTAASILDMKWHELAKDTDWSNFDVAAFEKKACEEMGLIDEIIPRYRSTYFNHIFNSGYNAGYYSYLWAEVLDKDAFEYWESKGLYNPKVASKFRKTFLEKGGSEEPMVLYHEFRGSDPDPDALVRARGL